jgi:hypothetical protein
MNLNAQIGTKELLCHRGAFFERSVEDDGSAIDGLKQYELTVVMGANSAS